MAGAGVGVGVGVGVSVASGVAVGVASSSLGVAVGVGVGFASSLREPPEKKVVLPPSRVAGPPNTSSDTVRPTTAIANAAAPVASASFQ